MTAEVGPRNRTAHQQATATTAMAGASGVARFATSTTGGVRTKTAAANTPARFAPNVRAAAPCTAQIASATQTQLKSRARARPPMWSSVAATTG
jgi:hypothetical protein